MPKIITANHLAAGDVVFLAENGWTPHVDRALVALDDAALAPLERRAAEAEAAVLRYLDKVAEAWQRMERAGITRIDQRSRGRALAAERDWVAEAEQCALLRHQAS